MEEKLEECIGKVLHYLETTEEFILEQAPVVVQEFYNWQTIGAILSIVLGICLIILGNIFIRFIDDVDPEVWLEENSRDSMKDFKRSHKKYRGKMYRDNGEYIPMDVLARTIGVFLGSLIIFFNLLTLLKILVAPKLYLLEHLQGIL